ncbi:retrotransposon protein, putative, ty1-copia subclass [Tanacetum coccineum]|uniref:Retrotransposon protein, putative, ty1-copia subclass n=1 Tax=Tanacetum coccineum TaxID=301880 RepID=A0ABQ5AFW8_9ASTR
MAIHERNQSDFVDLPPNCKTIGSKWLFKKNTNMDGIDTTPSKLVCSKRFYSKPYWGLYEETFSPVGRHYAIRILVAIDAAFCEIINDRQKSMQASKVAFVMVLSKQSRRAGKRRFDEEIKKFGYAQNLDELCVHHKASGSNVTFLILYVVDIIIMGNHIPSLQSVKSYLGKYFAMKDLGEATFILGIKIYRYRSKQLIGLSQSAYMNKILKRFRMDNSKRGNISMKERFDLSKT